MSVDVTVMFCDLLDSTWIATKLDAEEWRDLVGACSSTLLGGGGGDGRQGRQAAETGATAGLSQPDWPTINSCPSPCRAPFRRRIPATRALRNFTSAFAILRTPVRNGALRSFCKTAATSGNRMGPTTVQLVLMLRLSTDDNS